MEEMDASTTFRFPPVRVMLKEDVKTIQENHGLNVCKGKFIVIRAGL